MSNSSTKQIKNAFKAATLHPFSFLNIKYAKCWSVSLHASLQGWIFSTFMASTRKKSFCLLLAGKKRLYNTVQLHFCATWKRLVLNKIRHHTSPLWIIRLWILNLHHAIMLPLRQMVSRTRYLNLYQFRQYISVNAERLAAGWPFFGSAHMDTPTNTTD